MLKEGNYILKLGINQFPGLLVNIFSNLKMLKICGNVQDSMIGNEEENIILELVL